MEYENNSAYFNKVRETPLLNRQQEINLAKKIQMGNTASARLASAIADSEQLEVHERRKLQRQVSVGAESRQTFIKSNLLLVASIARRYTNSGMTLMDLVQEGSFGLMTAVEKFDHTRGNKFSTYATSWIKQAIQRSIHDKVRTIRVPEEICRTYNRIRKTSQTILAEGRDATPEEIAGELEMDSERVEEILCIFQGMVSLDAPLGEDGDGSLNSVLRDESALNPESNVEMHALSSEIERILGGLSERERQIIRRRFSFDDDHQWTLEEVGREYNLTRERIRQIEIRTLANLRQSGDLHALIKML